MNNRYHGARTGIGMSSILEAFTKEWGEGARKDCGIDDTVIGSSGGFIIHQICAVFGDIQMSHAY
jgi:hypothetical protein